MKSTAGNHGQESALNRHEQVPGIGSDALHKLLIKSFKITQLIE